MLIHCHWYKTLYIGCKGCMWHDRVCTKRIGLYLLHLACCFVTRNAKKEKEVNKFKVISDKFALVHVVGKEVLTNAFFVRGCSKELIIIWQVCISFSIIPSTQKSWTYVPSLCSSFGKHLQNSTLAPIQKAGQMEIYCDFAISGCMQPVLEHCQRVKIQQCFWSRLFLNLCMLVSQMQASA